MAQNRTLEMNISGLVISDVRTDVPSACIEASRQAKAVYTSANSRALWRFTQAFIEIFHSGAKYSAINYEISTYYVNIYLHKSLHLCYFLFTQVFSIDNCLHRYKIKIGLYAKNTGLLQRGEQIRKSRF